ncbi:hypothetical protein WN944_024474 [Citrus x changshan-huyou]|uniref:Uncharacterized protein n=1 Tax=Citrus x changshan-huyou TaxID=2935761 RepID=A0AAP0LNR3_9ROSI
MKKIAGLGPIISNVDGEIMTAVKQAPEALKAVVKGSGGTPELLLHHLCRVTAPSSPRRATSELLF